jgi:hypothetical protein
VADTSAASTSAVSTYKVVLPPPPENKWRREQAAFLRLLPELLRTHREKYVAVHEGKVVESGEDLIAVALKAYAKHGYVPIFVDRVTEEPPRPVRIPSPRAVQSSTAP